MCFLLWSCLWIVPEGCSQDSPYECLEGTAAGQCSSENWYGNSECKTSCIHSKALFFSPACEISATCEKWIPGPIADPPKKGEKEAFPRYEHDPAKLTLEKRGIDTKSLLAELSRLQGRLQLQRPPAAGAGGLTPRESNGRAGS